MPLTLPGTVHQLADRSYLNVCNENSRISFLPPEILSEIFSLAAQRTILSSYEYDHDLNETAHNWCRLQYILSLATVCGRWNTIVMNQANLWTSIVVTSRFLAHGPEDLDDVYLETKHMESFLERSHQFPLQIYIDARHRDQIINAEEETYEPGPGGELYFMSQHMKDAVSLLLPHINRWQSLTIITSHSKPMSAALKLVLPIMVIHGARFLETLWLQRDGNLDPDDMVEVPEFEGLNIWPRLKHLTLHGVYVDWKILGKKLTASSASLETLRLRNHCPDFCPLLNECTTILSAVSSSLQTLVIQNSGLSEFLQLPKDYIPIHLPSLCNFVLGYDTIVDAQVVYSLLEMPNLRSLTLVSAIPRFSYGCDDDPLLLFLVSEEHRYIPELGRCILNLKNLERLSFQQASLSEGAVSSILGCATKLSVVPMRADIPPGVWMYACPV